MALTGSATWLRRPFVPICAQSVATTAVTARVPGHRVADSAHLRFVQAEQARAHTFDRADSSDPESGSEVGSRLLTRPMQAPALLNEGVRPQ
jgi:hypothetical protein